MIALYWFDAAPEWRPRLKACAESAEPWSAAITLANTRLDFTRTNQLDETLRRVMGTEPPTGLAAKPVRLAILGSCTTAQLHSAIRMGLLRRNIQITVTETEYGQYWQELSDPGSALHAFRPTAILFALDAHHLAAGIDAGLIAQHADAALADILARIGQCWRLAREAFQCHIIHQTPLAVHPALLGGNEHRLPGSKAAFIARLGAALRPMADSAGVDLLALDERAARDGLTAWHDAGLWHRAKQEISPTAAPMYGDLVGRLIAARLGRSFKCLVLDLDNTLWAA